jgi:phosphoribosyl 1,2-cyclic phosphodiesterase
MRFRLTALASGSSGNAFLLQAGQTSLLIDCGLPARQIVRELKRRGIPPEELAAILITHEHGDHVLSAGVLSRRYGVPVLANPATLEAIAGPLGQVYALPMATGSAHSLGDVDVASFHVPHDAADPVGYLLECDGWRIAVAVDVGAPSTILLEPLRLADLIVLEANHDRARLLRGPYPAFVKARILSPLGHLSNQEAAQLLAQVAGGKRRSVWLAHLSAINNSPRRALRTVTESLQAACVGGLELHVVPRDRPSIHWDLDEWGWQERLL